MMDQVTLKIFGRVQGVFFRAEAREKARELSLVGWVRNASDGSVEVLAQGPAEKLQEFVEWCEKGPDAADVSHVDEKWGTAKERFSSFGIKYTTDA